MMIGFLCSTALMPMKEISLSEHIVVLSFFAFFKREVLVIGCFLFF